jgi:Holliday junction DNA helicase RuvA
MITYLKGTLIEKSPTSLVVDVGGIGYEVAIPLSSFDSVGACGENVEVLTHLHVREDCVQLFGFASTEERTLFQQLLSVSGVGPKLAQSILSGSSVQELTKNIVNGNVEALGSIRGIGKRTAERLVVELREKLGGMDIQPAFLRATAHGVGAEVVEQALLALVSLGYPRSTAQSVLEKTLTHEADTGEQLNVEELLRRALRNV